MSTDNKTRRSLYKIFAKVAIGIEYLTSFITLMILSKRINRNNLNTGLNADIIGSIDNKSTIAMKLKGYIQKDLFPFCNLMSAVIHLRI